MEKLKGEQKPKKGKLFAYIFTKDDETFRLQQKAYDLFTGNIDIFNYIYLK